MERNPLIWEAARLPLPLGAWRSSSQTPPADPWSWGSGIWPDVAPSRTGRRRSWGGQSGSWGRLWWAWRCERCQPCSGSGHTSPPSEPALREGEREESKPISESSLFWSYTMKCVSLPDRVSGPPELGSQLSLPPCKCFHVGGLYCSAFCIYIL